MLFNSFVVCLFVCLFVVFFLGGGVVVFFVFFWGGGLGFFFVCLFVFFFVIYFSAEKLGIAQHARNLLVYANESSARSDEIIFFTFFATITFTTDI